jgi:FKBP-type peptidyl-prolyl cis-trans isomerase FkpA/FKBP-type peptidyl-prolyl cis-trans isomerase FklB
MHTSIRIGLVLLLLPLISCEPSGEMAGGGAQASTDGSPNLADESEQILYTIGFTLSGQLAGFALDEEELRVVGTGLKDGVLGQEPKVDFRPLMPKVQAFQQERLRQVAEVEKAAGKELAAKAAAEPGAVVTDSGLVFQELMAGEGEQPKLTDTLQVHYHGTLRDGRVFDSSVERGEPAQFPLNRVINCWTEALPMMKVGSKARLTCPSTIAYGDRGAPPMIKPGATLTFEVELLGIIPPQE